MAIQIGQQFTTNNYGVLTVVGYRNSKHIEVEFIDTGYRTTTIAGNIKRGCVKDRLRPSVHGAGYIGIGRHVAKANGKQDKGYQTWCGMLERCYSQKSLAKHPSYEGCTVCDEWHNFQVFA